MYSNYTSTVKITNNYRNEQPQIGNNYKSTTPTNNNATRVYISPEKSRYDSINSNGYDSYENGRESPPKGGAKKSLAGKFSKSNYSDFKEDYEPDYRKNENIYWRDPERDAKLKKDFYINHKKISEEEYNRYLEKENIKGRSLLNRNEDDIRDRARDYYDRNKTKKASRTVSEIFSKKTHTKPAENPADPAESKYKTTSFLKGDYVPVYKTKLASFQKNEDTKDEPKKQQVYFSDTYEKTTEIKKPNFTGISDYKLPSYYRGIDEVDTKDTKFGTDTQKEIRPLYISKPFVNVDAKNGNKSHELFSSKKSISNEDLDRFKSSRDDYRRSPDYRDYSPGKSPPKTILNHTYKPEEYLTVKHKYDSLPSQRFGSPTRNGRNKVSFSDDVSPRMKSPDRRDRIGVFSVADGPSYTDEEKDNRNIHLMNMYYSKDLRYSKEYDGPPPKRIDWIHNKKGVTINEIVDGQPCDNCPETCMGFKPHAWRKTCQSCKCPRESHAIYQEECADVRARLGLIAPSQWAPPGLPPVKAEAFLKASGAGNVEDRMRRLAKQLPRQDLAAGHCRHLESKHKASYEDFIAARNEIALDIGYAKENNDGPINCPTCHLPVKSGDLGVVATRLGDDVMFHPACFTCTKCKELLADLAYCALDDHPYCERHYAEMLKPRCAACDESFQLDQKVAEGLRYLTVKQYRRPYRLDHLY